MTVTYLNICENSKKLKCFLKIVTSHKTKIIYVRDEVADMTQIIISL
jgi:hypothetical protein